MYDGMVYFSQILRKLIFGEAAQGLMATGHFYLSGNDDIQGQTTQARDIILCC
jgi:chemotaxis methyl-accepting protein methylase